MTNKFEQFLNQSKPEPADEGIEIDAGIACQICYEQADEPAVWNIEKKTLKWTCPNGHPNVIKDFKGF